MRENNNTAFPICHPEQAIKPTLYLYDWMKHRH